jgi:hypothetical protein
MHRRHALLELTCGTVDPKQSGGAGVEQQLRPSASRVQRVLRRLPGTTRYNMTIAAEPEFVWYRVAKVGTRSLVRAFHESGVRFIADHPYGIVVPSGLISNFYCFAFVRDPRTRLVSAWQDKVVGQNHFGLPADLHSELQDFSRFVDWVATKDLRNCDNHLRLQVALMNQDRVDFVGRMESFRDDFAKLCQHLGLAAKELPHRNKTPSAPAVYTPELLRRVEELYRADLEAFDY